MREKHSFFVKYPYRILFYKFKDMFILLFSHILRKVNPDTPV
jgi:hypothetical protein